MSSQGLTDTRIDTGVATHRVGQQVGAGSEASVYRLQEQKSVALKAFKSRVRQEKESKVRAMIKTQPVVPTYDRRRSWSLAWPREIARRPESGEFLGYTMPYIDAESLKPALEYAMVNLSRNNSTKRERFGSALNLATAVKAVHDRGHAIGDFNHENILLDDKSVTLIDCDSFEVSGNQRTHSGNTYFGRYAPPEKRGDGPREVQKTDRFCLGVHIFQFLLGGVHPFQAQSANGDWPNVIKNTPFPYLDDSTGVRPVGDTQELYDQLPSTVRTLFKRCFVPAFERPKHSEWIETVQRAT